MARELMALLPALLLAAGGVAGLCGGKDVYAALLRGARQGLDTLLQILPALVCLLPAVSMFRASGAAEALARLLSPLLEGLGIPSDCVLLMLLRPVSGSAALLAGRELILSAPDGLLGRTAAVMLGSTETTFYVLSVYFGAAGVKKSRHALPAALCADLAGFLAAAWTVRLFWG